MQRREELRGVRRKQENERGTCDILDAAGQRVNAIDQKHLFDAG